jgi:LacI family transcriptional regulator
MPGKPGIEDVAARAGVSIATVSRVLNNTATVSDSTRAKVMAALGQINYRPNAIAKHLRLKKSRNIGIVFTSITKDFYSIVSKGIEDTARKFDYNVFICNSGDDPLREKEYLTALQDGRTDGIIIAPTTKNGELIRQLISLDIPVCFIDRTLEGIECDRVLVNNREATKEAVGHLIGKGYGRIGFISGPHGKTSAYMRHRGYLDALEGAGASVDEGLSLYGDSSIDSGYRLARELVEKRSVDALMLANEHVGAGSLQYLQDRGMRPGSDIGFVMWDDPFWTRLMTPRITVVSQPVYTIGTTAAGLLFRRIRKEMTERGGQPVKVVLHARFVERGSA